MAEIVGIQHVALPLPAALDAVTDERRFYGEVLGLEETRVPETLRGVIVWFRAGDQELHLYEEQTGAAVNDQSRRHPCFQVDDLVAFRDRLEQRGVDTIDATGDIPGRPRFF